MSISVHCWGTGIRTPIHGFKGRCPTIRRSPSDAHKCIAHVFYFRTECGDKRSATIRRSPNVVHLTTNRAENLGLVVLNC